MQYVVPLTCITVIKVIFNLADGVLTIRGIFLVSFTLDSSLPRHRSNFHRQLLPFKSVANCLKDIPRYNKVPFSAEASISKDTTLSLCNTKKQSNHATILKQRGPPNTKKLGP